MGGKKRSKFRSECLSGRNVRIRWQKTEAYPLADTAVVFFDLYFWERLGFDSDRYGTAVTASGVHFESLAIKFRQFACELWWIIGWLEVVPAIITSKSISGMILEGIKHE
jgi:hypothetical protein